MKKSTMTVNWPKIFAIGNLPTNPKGYSTASQIAQDKKLSLSFVHARLKRLRDSGCLKAIKGRSSQGKLIWFYKD